MLCSGQPVLLQPRFALGRILQLRLQPGQRAEPRFEFGQRGPRLLRLRRGVGALLARASHLLVLLRDFLFLFGQRRLLLLHLFLHRLDLAGHRCGNLALLRFETFAAPDPLEQRFPRIRVMRIVDPQALLGLAQRTLDFGEGCCRHAHRLFQRRQPLIGRLFTEHHLPVTADRGLERGFGRLQFVGGLLLLRVEAGQLRAQLGDLLSQPLLRVPRILQLLFMARHLGICGIELALRRVQRIAGLVMAAFLRFDLRVFFVQARLQAFEFGGKLCDLRGQFLARASGVLHPRRPDDLLRDLQPRFQFAIFGGDLRLRFELFQLRAEFAPDVVDPRQVVLRVVQPRLGFATALAIFRNPRRLFEKHPQIFGLGFDDPRNHPLLDDCVRARPESGTHEQVGDVAAAHHLIVDVIGRVALAGQHALDRQLGELAPLAADAAQAVVEHQLDAGAPDALAFAGAVENDVLHRFAAQRRCPGFPQHPAHRVDHIGFTTAVGADNRDELAWCGNMGGVDERLEARQFD